MGFEAKQTLLVCFPLSFVKGFCFFCLGYKHIRVAVSDNWCVQNILLTRYCKARLRLGMLSQYFCYFSEFALDKKYTSYGPMYT